MKRVSLLLMVVVFLCAATGYAVTVYQNDYEGETLGAGFPAWNWGDNGMVHTAVFADWGSMVVEHNGTVTNTGTEDINCRFGSKWDITMSGNTSSNPAHYTISFDVMSVSGPWEPINLEMFVLTYNDAIGTGTYGWGTGAMSFSQLDGWVHVEANLADLGVGWWEGQDWDLTNPTWSLEFGGPPWPGNPVAPGESVDQLWLMDNLKIEMNVPEPASLVLLGLGSFALLKKRK